MNTKVYQRHEGSRTQPGIRRHWDSEMVSGRGIRGAPRHEKPHRRDDQGRAITPAANHLFEVNKTTRKLNEKDAQAFHTIVEKLLFLCKRARPNILTGVALLTTQVREPDGDDDEKLS